MVKKLSLSVSIIKILQNGISHIEYRILATRNPYFKNYKTNAGPR